MHHHHPHTTSSNAAPTNSGNGATTTTTPSASSSTQQQQQQPTQRRRKKRPNYGTRTVEVRRGYSGFGFTISGQQPCRLSCIIPNSPADQAGLRAGDFLISVNGLNVSKLPHETVVQLIGNSFGSIRMQIAEYYYSDSTDDENAAAASGIPTLPNLGPSRPRYIYHKNKHQRLRHHMPQRKLQESLLPLPRPSVSQQQQLILKKTSLPNTKKPLVNSEVPSVSSSVAAPKRSISEELKSMVSAPCHAAAMANVRAMMVRAPVSAALEYRAVVGYMGTIEMPKQIAHSSKLQTVRSCIRKLRQEKRQPSMVLMVILPDCLKLQSSNGNILATYPSARLNYVSSSSESENRFFGLVTSAVYTPQLDECDEDEDEVEGDEGESIRSNEAGAAASASNTADSNVIISNSCHVFVVDTKLCDHQQHLAKAQEFRIQCTKDPISSLCLEFPNNSEYVVNLIRSMYTMRIIPQAAAQRSISDDPNLHRNNSGGAVLAHSPQPSNHSEVSTTTSNSDSGIGYNNDCSNVTDRIVVVDFPQIARLRAPGDGAGLVKVVNRPQNICQQNISAEVEEGPSTSTAATNKSLSSVRDIADSKVAAYHLNSPGRSLIASRSCDDVLNLIEHETEDFGIDPITVTQPCYASMDDISLHTASMENDESQKMTQHLGKTPKDSKLVGKCCSSITPKPLKLNVSLRDESPPIAKEMSPNKLCSTPDLSRPELDGNMSPFERGWVQTSLRTPRADKHTINFSINQEDKPTCQQQQQQQQQQQSYKSPGLSRSASMSNSERGSFKSKLPLKEKSKAVKKGPTAWGSCIESLLSDPAGLKTFAEFLKMEYAAENIYFWTACERFRNIEDLEERQSDALHIYTKHLSNGSLEPVNVDSQARSLVERNLVNADRELFHLAQKQIFNLMKFDSYQRFLRSDLYKQCLQAEKKGKSLPYTGDNLDDLLKTTNFSESASSKLKKSASNAEEGRPRRSLLPWHRKTRSKSRDQIAQDAKEQPNSTSTKTMANGGGVVGSNLRLNAMHGSESSLASFDAITFGNTLTPNDLNCSLCRIKFPDGATTMVQLKSPETVGQLIERLMEKRSIRYQFFDVTIKGPPHKSVDLKASVQQIAGKEVEIEQRVAFKLDLPTPKVISVKSKPRKQLYEVVRPILQRYNINPEIVEVLMRDTQEKVDLTQLVTAVNEQRLQVIYKSKVPKSLPISTVPKSISNVAAIQTNQTTLDEITNKVFSDLMHVKQIQSADGNAKPKFDQNSLKSDDCPSETSSFFKSRRGKRESIGAAGHRSASKSKKTSAHHAPSTAQAENKNPLHKIKCGVKLQLPIKAVDKQDDLLEDLKRAQLARLEDQRGTEINFELPEFLRNTDNTHSRMPTSPSSNNATYENNHLLHEKPPQPAPRMSIANKLKALSSISPMKVDDDQQHHDDLKSLVDDNDELFHTTLSKGPPPLPPKPKVLPIKPSNWGVTIISPTSKLSPNNLMPPPTPTIASPQLTNANVVAVSASTNSGPNARCAYLDQPSSSFV